MPLLPEGDSPLALMTYGKALRFIATGGGIVAAHTGTEGIPQEWLDSHESLPDWPFLEID